MRKIATLAALALVAAACGSSDSEPAATTTTTTTAAATTTTEPVPTASYPEFTGGDFYAPASLPDGEHGDVIWAEEIEAPAGAKGSAAGEPARSAQPDPGCAGRSPERPGRRTHRRRGAAR